MLAAAILTYGLIRGDQPERWCALILTIGIVLDRIILHSIGLRSFEQFDASRLAIDGLQMILLFAVALRANRVYPIAIASGQLIAVMGSLSAIFVQAGFNYAYWAMTQLPLLLQLLILGFGTHLHRRRVARIGNYNSWSPSTIGRPDRA